MTRSALFAKVKTIFKDRNTLFYRNLNDNPLICNNPSIHKKYEGMLCTLSHHIAQMSYDL